MKTEECSTGTGTVIVHTRKEIEEASRPLMRFMDTSASPSSNGPPYSSINAQQVTGQIVIRLQSWISEPKSQILCIISPQFSSNRHEASIAAQHIMSVVQNADVPYVAATVSNLEPGPEVLNKTSQHLETARLVMLLYSLIRQLTLLVPDPVGEATSSITTLLESLDGTKQSVPAAVKALRALLRHTPSLLICVIDGLQLLDHPDLEQYVDELLVTLRAGDDSRVLKVLLTSEGFFSSGANLTVDERLDCLHSPRRRPGDGRPGARNLNDVSLSF